MLLDVVNCVFDWQFYHAIYTFTLAFSQFELPFVFRSLWSLANLVNDFCKYLGLLYFTASEVMTKSFIPKSKPTYLFVLMNSG